LETRGKQWRPLPTKGPGLGGETACDPESRTVVAVVGRQTWVFSCETNEWTLAQAEAPVGGRVPESTFCWDSVAQRFVLVTHFQQSDPAQTGPRTWLYDRPNNRWTPSAAQGDRPAVSGLAGYYDPARNVTLIYSDRETWVYRAKRAAK
jgi:hypothetical protein